MLSESPVHALFRKLGASRGFVITLTSNRTVRLASGAVLQAIGCDMWPVPTVPMTRRAPLAHPCNAPAAIVTNLVDLYGGLIALAASPVGALR